GTSSRRTFVGPVPGEGERRLVRVSLEVDRQRRTRPGREQDVEGGSLDRVPATRNLDRSREVLAVGAHLNGRRARFEGVDVDQRQRDPLRFDRLDESRYVLGQAGAAI